MNIFENHIFENFSFNFRKNCITAQSKNKEYIVKIELEKYKNKNLDIEGEYAVINFLNKKDCQTCPKVYKFDSIEKNLLEQYSNLDLKKYNKEKFNYIVQEYIPNENEYTLSDILLTIIEQKKLGIYQGDVKPENIRFNPKNKICYFIDYDQAIYLEDDKKEMKNDDFFKFMSKYDKEKYGVGDWLRHFKNKYTNTDVENLTVEGSLNLIDVSLIKHQNTTNTINGLYHTIEFKDIFLNGNRDIKERSKLLDNVTFAENEKVLDVGCNQGLLSFYLQERGCDVTGHDIDPSIITAANITKNILGKKIKFECKDLDQIKSLEKYDTIFLFSVFHHTRYQIQNAKKISESCNRFIIETRLHENGSQPIGPDGSWINVSKWRFETLDNLITSLEEIFIGFKFNKNIGIGSKGRYILEFIKT